MSQRRSPVPQGTGEHPRLRHTTATLIGFFVACVALILLPAEPGYAHAQLLSSTPANGARLTAMPAEITLRFSERVNPVRGGIRLLQAGKAERTADGAVTDAGAPNQIRVPVPAGLGDGSYTVIWRVVSADSHPINGAFVFAVGDARLGDVPDPDAGTGTGRAMSTVYWLFRMLGYAGLAVLSGGVAFLLLCWPAGWRRRRSGRLLLAAGAASCGAAVGVLLLQGPYAAGGTLASVGDPALLRATLGTDYGRYVLVRLGLLAACGAVLLRMRAMARLDPEFDPIALAPNGRPGVKTSRLAGAGLLAAVCVALPATWVGTGHANAEASLLAAAADTVHLAAMAVWFGGLVFLIVCLLPDASAVPTTEAATAIIRFSTIAAGSVVALVATGTYQAWRSVGSVGALAGTSYGTIFVFKLGAVAVLLWLGAMSRSVVRRRFLLPAAQAARNGSTGSTGGAGRAVRAGTSGTAAGGETGSRAGTAVKTARRAARGSDLLARRQLRSTVRAEVMIAAAVLALTSVLVATPPATRPAPASALPPSTIGPVPDPTATVGTLAGGGRVEVRLTPARLGDNTVAVAVRDASGNPWDVPEVSASLRLPAQSLGPIAVPLARRSPGEYASSTVQLPLVGTWLVQVKVRTSEIEQSTVEVRVPVDWE